MDANRVYKQIEQGQLSPVYACYGKETHLMRTFVEKVIAQAALPEHREFAVTNFDLQETPIEVVIEDVETLPFMVPKKIVVANNATFLTSKNKAKVDHQLDRLFNYIENPVDYAILLLLVAVEKLDARKKIVRELKANNQLVSFKPMRANELENWVKSQAVEKGSSITDEAVMTLLMYTGPKLQTIDAELEKCSIYVGDETITHETIKQLVSRSVEQTVFMLIDEIVEMKIDHALTMLHELFKQREEPIKIAMLMARQFRIVLQVGELAKRGLSPQQMATQLGLHPFAARLAMRQAQRFDAAALSRILSELAELDFKMKSGAIDKERGLELFLLRLKQIKQPLA